MGGMQMHFYFSMQIPLWLYTRRKWFWKNWISRKKRFEREEIRWQGTISDIDRTNVLYSTCTDAGMMWCRYHGVCAVDFKWQSKGRTRDFICHDIKIWEKWCYKKTAETGLKMLKNEHELLKTIIRAGENYFESFSWNPNKKQDSTMTRWYNEKTVWKILIWGVFKWRKLHYAEIIVWNVHVTLQEPIAS